MRKHIHTHTNTLTHTHKHTHTRRTHTYKTHIHTHAHTNTHTHTHLRHTKIAAPPILIVALPGREDKAPVPEEFATFSVYGEVPAMAVYFV